MHSAANIARQQNAGSAALQTLFLLVEMKSAQITCVLMRAQVADKLRRFEREVRTLDLTLTPDSLATIAHFDAALSRPGGALLLIGACGAGRRAALSLVAHAHHLTVFTPACAFGATMRQTRALLKDALRAAGGAAAAPTLLVLEDHQVADAAVLERANSLLASGEIPGLFTAEELDKELAGVEADGRDGGEDGTASPCDVFVARVRKVRPAPWECPMPDCRQGAI